MILIDKIVIASGNSSKVDRYKRLFTGIAGEIIGLRETGVTDKPKETGETAEQNAEIKAIFYSEKIKLPVFCEDEALYADFLSPSEQPGVHVRRINRVDEVDDDKLLDYWKEIVAQTPVDKRFGHWHVAYCLARPDGNFRVISSDFPIMFFHPPSEKRLKGWPLSSLQGSALIGKRDADYTEEDYKIVDQNRNQQLTAIIKELF